MYLALALALALSCSGKDADTAAEAPAAFPDDFYWGAATAGFQVEPGCPTISAEVCEDRGSDWYQWVTDEALIGESATHLAGEPLSAAPGHYELYEEDIARLKDELGANALRVSIEWSRLFPDRAAEAATTVDELAAFVDPEALAWYHAYFQAMRDQGIEPFVTLNHYTLPLWLHDGKACYYDIDGCADRGWLDGDRIIPAIALYSGFCAREFGGEVDWWMTLNEPFAVILSGYLLPGEDRTNPPGVTLEVDYAFEVLWNMVEAHARMYDAVHAEDPTAMVGLVPNLVAAYPEDEDDPIDVEGTAALDYLYNRLMLNATIRGEVDRDLDRVAESTDADLAGRMDFIGVNYYTRLTVMGLEAPLFADYPGSTFYPVGSFWQNYPEGLREVLNLAAEYELPVVVTENGTPDPDGEEGAQSLVRHAQALRDAIGDGVDLRGYLYWSLVDNYEWNHGMSMTFGLYEVPPTDPEKPRSPRLVADLYSQIVQANAIPEDLEAEYGE